MAAERPSLGRDDSYNRVRLPRDLKSQIMSMIADSSESLPLNTVAESEESLPDAVGAVTKNQEEQQKATEPDKSHLAAPPTTNGNTSKLATEEPLNASDFPTPTPDKPNPLDQMPTEQQIGTTASRATTAQSVTPSETASGKKEGRPGMDKRQSTMKRISSAFKRSVSHKQ